MSREFVKKLFLFRVAAGRFHKLENTLIVNNVNRAPVREARHNEIDEDAQRFRIFQ